MVHNVWTGRVGIPIIPTRRTNIRTKDLSACAISSFPAARRFMPPRPRPRRPTRWPRWPPSTPSAPGATPSTPPWRPAPCSAWSSPNRRASAATASRRSRSRDRTTSSPITVLAARRGALTAEWLLDQGVSTIKQTMPHAVTVPGAVEAWARMVGDHGRLSLAKVLEPAIRYAREGFPVYSRVSVDFAAQESLLRADPMAFRTYMPGGKMPRVGDIIKQPELADTLQRIAEEGPAGFYNRPGGRGHGHPPARTGRGAYGGRLRGARGRLRHADPHQLSRATTCWNARRTAKASWR